MMTEQLITLIQQAEALPATEQLMLIAHLAEKMRLTSEYVIQAPSPTASVSTNNSLSTSTGKTLLQLADDFTTNLSAETLARLPSDGSVEHDHYIYGTSRIYL